MIFPHKMFYALENKQKRAKMQTKMCKFWQK